MNFFFPLTYSSVVNNKNRGFRFGCWPNSFKEIFPDVVSSVGVDQYSGKFAVDGKWTEPEEENWVNVLKGMRGSVFLTLAGLGLAWTKANDKGLREKIVYSVKWITKNFMTSH